MVQWSFDESQYKEGGDFPLLPIGDYRLRIAEVEEKTSKNGNDMFEIKLDVSGQECKLFYNLVFLPGNAQMTNQRIGEICDSFGIPKGDPNLIKTVGIGKVGGARIKHEDYNGEKRAKVHYFLTGPRKDNLPAWIEPEGTGAPTPVAVGQPVNIPMDEIPFNEIPDV